ncbi:MAG: choice-of-anchor H family protein [Woeseiaceae bacterium]|nr:choice-of-anchor H family protein [Woeseiaceae bacterium]
MNHQSSETFTWPQAIAWALAIVAMLASTVLFAAEAAEADARVTINSHYLTDGREQAVPDKVTTNESAAMAQAGKPSATRDTSALRSMKQQSAASQSSVPNTDFWFYDVDVDIYGDRDIDGYYTTVDVWFDVDTWHTLEEVYAVLYLSYEGGPWEEYADTEDFWIRGSSGNDDYVIISDLVSGYPTGSYDLLIELFDAWDDSFVAYIGPEDTSELSLLTLEDEQRDAAIGPAPRPEVVSRGGGGSTDVFTLALFVLASVAAGVVAVRRRRQPGSLVRATGPRHRAGRGTSS